MRILLLVMLFFVQAINCFGQLKPDIDNVQQPVDDSIVIDSVKLAIAADSVWRADSVRINAPVPSKTYQAALNELLKKNTLINLTQKSISLKNNKEKHHGKEYLFYLLSSILLIFGFFKVFYTTYFNNIFRVFFNTSLRQNQLTDLLLQAKLPSLIFNIFFIVTGGLYLWLLLNYYHFIDGENHRKALLFCIVIISFIYIIKFCVLKFIGWVTGMTESLDTYIFIIFLVNKIAGIILIFFILLLAFAAPEWQSSVVTFSFLVIGVLFLLRFMRSYSLLQHRLDISRMHFILYIISIEVLPLLVVYKWFLKIMFKA
ncbi:MAG: DUF4271 domain-containing protein [Ginsengibacter sp.]